jgi:hypothetical protein
MFGLDGLSKEDPGVRQLMEAAQRGIQAHRGWSDEETPSPD